MPKYIILCFDGTGNHPRDAKQERSWFGTGEIKDNGITNVLKLHTLLGGNISNEPSNLTRLKNKQHSFYYSGVGTHGNRLQRIFNSGFAPSSLDIQAIMYRAKNDLRAAYEPGDEIVITGFSRGAAIARKFASRLGEFLPNITGNDGKPPIALLAVFDTVASIGVPNLEDDDKPKSDVVFENCTVSPHVRKAVHFVSIDDRRIAFHPTLMNHEDRVTEIWFPGAHSDVGGGFWRDGLSDVTLQAMIVQIKQHTDLDVKDPMEADFKNLKRPNTRSTSKTSTSNRNMKAKCTSRTAGDPSPFSRSPHGTCASMSYDEPSDKHVVKIHKSVFQRIKKVIEYRPKTLKGVKHHIVNDKGDIMTLNDKDNIVKLKGKKIAGAEINGLYRYI